MCGRADDVRALLADGADTEVNDEEGNETALSRAASEGHADCVRMLLECGAQKDAANWVRRRLRVAYALAGLSLSLRRCTDTNGVCQSFCFRIVFCLCCTRVSCMSCLSRGPLRVAICGGGGGGGSGSFMCHISAERRNRPDSSRRERPHRVCSSARGFWGQQRGQRQGS
jgi:hypothetical protein